VSHRAIAALFAGASLLALWLLLVALRRARGAGDLDSSTALTFGMGFLFNLPVALVAVAGGLERTPDPFKDLILILPGWYQRVADLSVLLIAGLAAFLLIKRLSVGHIYVNTAGAFAVLLWVVALLSAGLQGGNPLSGRGGALLLCLLAATVLPRGRGACLGAGILGVTLAIASGILAVFRYDVAFIVPCEGACSWLGFTGVLPNENLLGVTLAASVPFAYLGFRGRPRTWLALFLACGAVATGSRTAALAAVITVTTLLIVRPRLDADRTPRLMAGAWLVLGGAVATSVYVVRHHWNPTALTDRPEAWEVAWRYIGRSPWFGYGPEKWGSLSASSEIPLAAQRSTHNQWTDVLFIAGGVGAVVFVGIGLATIVSAGRARAGVVLALAAMLMIGTTEGLWPPATLDLLSFSLVALILTGPTGESRLTPAPRTAALARPALPLRQAPRRVAGPSAPP
jgi:hypothetical protein